MVINSGDSLLDAAHSFEHVKVNLSLVDGVSKFYVTYLATQVSRVYSWVHT